MKLSSAVAFGVVSAGAALVLFALGDNLAFQRKAAGVMTAEAAASVGVVDLTGPWFQRVWFAPVGDGSFEVRPAAAFIGVVPFVSVRTTVDLQAACKRLGDACKAA